MKSVVGLSLYAENILESITRIASKGSSETSVIDSATMKQYRAATNELCSKIHKDPSINYLFYTRISFPNIDEQLDYNSYDYLAENCIRSESLILDGGLMEFDALDLRKLYLFLKTIRYFFEDNANVRTELYEDMEEMANIIANIQLSREVDSYNYLICRSSSASGVMDSCLEPMEPYEWLFGVLVWRNWLSKTWLWRIVSPTDNVGYRNVVIEVNDDSG